MNRNARASTVRRFLPLATLLAAGCTGGLDCGAGCANDYVYGTTAATVPNGVRGVDDGMRMRLSQAGLDFLQTHLRDILISQFDTLPGQPNTLAVPVGPLDFTTGNPAIRLGQSTPDGSIETRQSFITVDLQSFAQQLDFDFVDAENAIRFRVDNLPIGVDGRVYGEVDVGFTSDAACDVVGTEPGGFITQISFDVTIRPDVGRGAACDDAPPNSECLLLDVQIENLGVGDIGLDLNNPGTSGSRVCNDFSIPSNDFECEVACTGADFIGDVVLGIADFLIDSLDFILVPVLEGAINNALDGVDGAPIAASGRFDLAAAAPGVLPESSLDLGFSIAPTGSAFDVNAPAGQLGMDLILKSGFEAAPPLDPNELSSVPHPCVRPIVGQEFAQLFGGGVRGEFETNGTDSLSGVVNGTPYHLGASLAEPGLNQMMFALYNSGSLCLEVSSDSVHTLAGGAFDLSAATLDLLTGGKLKQFADPDAPAIIALAPARPPVISFGAGDAEEGHIRLEWKDVEISFYVLMFERFARVFAVSTDISVEMAVFNDPATETLQISVVEGPTVENFTENYNELLPGVSFQEVLESLIGVVFDAALGDEGLQFEYNIGTALSDALGVPIFVDFQGIETLPATDREFLNIYLSMTDTQPQPRTAAPTLVRPAANAGVLRLPEAEAVGRASRATIPTGEAHLTVDDADVREYFVRVDFGAWRGPLRANAGSLVVRDPKLSLAGEHTLYVRSRYVDDSGSLEAAEDAVATTVWVDPNPPEVTLAGDAGVVRAVAVDDFSVDADLRYAWSVGDGAFSDFGTDASFDLSGVTASRISVRAQDAAGNISRIASFDVRAAALRARSDDAPEVALSGGCAATPSTSSTTWLWLSLLAPLAVWRRRARR
jgi:hypothetical protein